MWLFCEEIVEELGSRFIFDLFFFKGFDVGKELEGSIVFLYSLRGFFRGLVFFVFVSCFFL